MPLSLYGQEGLRVKMRIEVLAVSITIVINMRRLTSEFQLHEIAAISTAFYGVDSDTRPPYDRPGPPV